MSRDTHLSSRKVLGEELERRMDLGHGAPRQVRATIERLRHEVRLCCRRRMATRERVLEFRQNLLSLPAAVDREKKAERVWGAECYERVLAFLCMADELEGQGRTALPYKAFFVAAREFLFAGSLTEFVSRRHLKQCFKLALKEASFKGTKRGYSDEDSDESSDGERGRARPVSRTHSKKPRVRSQAQPTAPRAAPTDPQACYKCGEKGHLKRNCPKLKATGSQ